MSEACNLLFRVRRAVQRLIFSLCFLRNLANVDRFRTVDLDVGSNGVLRLGECRRMQIACDANPHARRDNSINPLFYIIRKTAYLWFAEQTRNSTHPLFWGDQITNYVASN